MERRKPDQETIRSRLSRTIGEAALVNAGITVMSIIGSLAGGGNAAVAEAIHDGNDAATHGMDYLGACSDNGRVKGLLRKASSLAIVGGAGYFTYKSGADFLSGGSAPPEAAAVGIQAGVTAANLAVNHRFEQTVHELEHEIDDENFHGSHTHAKVDAVVSPAVLAGMTVSSITGCGEVSDLVACGAAAFTAAGNFRPLVQAWSPEH